MILMEAITMADILTDIGSIVTAAVTIATPLF